MKEAAAMSELLGQSRKAMRCLVGSGPLEGRLGRAELEILAIGSADHLPAPLRSARDRLLDHLQTVTEADSVEELEQLAEDLRAFYEQVVAQMARNAP